MMPKNVKTFLFCTDEVDAKMTTLITRKRSRWPLDSDKHQTNDNTMPLEQY
jgi:hypothetical protein